MLDCVTQCLQSAAHLCEQFLQVQQIGFVTLEPMHRGRCLELYYYNMVEWFWWDSSQNWNGVRIRVKVMVRPTVKVRVKV